MYDEATILDVGSDVLCILYDLTRDNGHSNTLPLVCKRFAQAICDHRDRIILEQLQRPAWGHKRADQCIPCVDWHVRMYRTMSTYTCGLACRYAEFSFEFNMVPHEGAHKITLTIKLRKMTMVFSYYKAADKYMAEDQTWAEMPPMVFIKRYVPELRAVVG